MPAVQEQREKRGSRRPRWPACQRSRQHCGDPTTPAAAGPARPRLCLRPRAVEPEYCCERLRTYGQRCGVRVTPHQLRHPCGTLLLSAGAAVLSAQGLLGHERVDTTLGCARLYDGTLAAG